MSIPADSWSASTRRIASRLPSSRAEPSRSQGAQSLPGSASHAGLGRLPAMVVCRTTRGPSGRSAQIPRGEAAAYVDFRAVAVADKLEASLAGSAVRSDPVADFSRAVAYGRQALVEKVDQRILVAFLEMADAFAVEGLIDLAHGGFAD